MRCPWPEGKQSAVVLSFDFDAESGFLFREHEKAKRSLADLEERRILRDQLGVKPAGCRSGCSTTRRSSATCTAPRTPWPIPPACSRCGASPSRSDG